MTLCHRNVVVYECETCPFTVNEEPRFVGVLEQSSCVKDSARRPEVTPKSAVSSMILR